MSRRSPVCRWKNFSRYSGTASADVCAGAGVSKRHASSPTAAPFRILITFIQFITKLLVRRWLQGLAPLVQSFDDDALQPGGEPGLCGGEVFLVVDEEGAIFDGDRLRALE